MKCQGKKSDGSSCQSNVMTGSNYCFTHNPETRERHAAATRKGGSSTGKAAVSLLPRLELKDGKSVLEMLRDTINRVRVVREDGSMDIATANSIGHLSGKYLECRKALELEAKVEELEKELEDVRRTNMEIGDEMYKLGHDAGYKAYESGFRHIEMEVKPVKF